MKRLLLLALITWACSSSGEREVLQEAARVHDEALDIAHRTALMISQIKQLEDRLPQAGRDSLQAVAEGLGEWYEVVVEVPGHEHREGDHDHHHGHSHHHTEAPNYLEALSPQGVLEVQMELRREVEHLRGRLMQVESLIAQKETRHE